MKKIYSKFTRERAPRFQIETAIYVGEDGSKCVKKHPLSPECEGHLDQIYQNYLFFNEQEKSLLAQCEKEDQSVVFSFVSGKSYYERLLGDVHRCDREAFYQTLKDYREKVEQMYPDCSEYAESELFASVFGNVDGLLKMEGANKLNIDLTFDNIITQPDGAAQIIDYEWMFDCLVPLKFVYFRAVQAFYMKNSVSLDGFIVVQDIYDFFGIADTECPLFEKMNAGFMSYVNGGDKGYEELLENYKKPAASLKGGASMNQVDVYVNTGTGYSNDNCILTMMPDESQTVRIEMDLTLYKGIREIRIDPLDVSAVIRMRKFTVERQGAVIDMNENQDQLLHNATIKNYDHDVVWVFHSDDPQMLIPVDDQDAIRGFVLEYEVLITNLEIYDPYVNPYREQLHNVIQTQEREKCFYEEKILQLEHENQLLKDMLNYIQGTRIYQMLLKKKIDGISVWDEIRK